MPPKKKNLPQISTDFLPPGAQGMHTRVENKGRQVGKPDIPRKRATKAEMVARRATEAKSKVDKEETHRQAIKKVASVEDAQEIMDKENEAQANKPHAKVIARVPRPSSAMTTKDDPFIVCDNEIDEDQPAEPQKEKAKKRTNKEKGADARNSVQAMRNTDLDSDKGKRKADIHTSPKKQSLKKSKAPRPAPVGLIKNWDEHPILSTQTSISEFSTSVVNSMKPESLDSDFIYGEGGISDNDERVEHDAVSASKFVKTEHKAIARIKEAVVDSRTNPMTSPKFKGRKAKVTLHDLPQGAGPNFGTLYIPLVKGYMGILPAWTDPQIPVFKKHWINVYGGLICGWDKDDPVRTLIGYRVESWHNGFAQHAMQAVESLVTNLFATKEERANFVKDTLGSNPANRPFYWKQREDGKKLLFQSDVITYTLSSHYKDIKNTSIHLLNLKPIGALVVRAFGFWITGEQVIPSSKLSHFSFENYGDRDILTASGTLKKEKRASGFLPTVEQLTVKQWSAIIAAAREFAFKEQSDDSMVTQGMEMDGSESDGFLLEQSDSDEEGDGSDGVVGADEEGDLGFVLSESEAADDAGSSGQTTMMEPRGAAQASQVGDPDADDDEY